MARRELPDDLDRALAADWRLLETHEPFDEETDGDRLIHGIVAALRSGSGASA